MGLGPVIPRKPLDKSPTDYAFLKRIGQCPSLRSQQGGVGRSPVMGQGTDPLRVPGQRPKFPKSQ